MTGPRLLIRTPSRLHFGLLGWGPGSRRQFGGLGLMIESPAIELTVEQGHSDVVEGPMADRVRRILATLRDQLSGPGIPIDPLSIRIIDAPPEHVGLGVGTQISLAIAAAVFQLVGFPTTPPTEMLARLTGRGGRSGVGLHGFERGGLIVDGGRKDDGAVPPLIARLAFPGYWSVIVVQPPGQHGLNGPDEVRAFADLPPVDESMTERLCRLVLLGVLPAVAERDLDGFGAAIEEIQAHVGACFAPAQGGFFSSPRAVEIVAELHRAGFVGCGQSSWGPTLYAFSRLPWMDVCKAAERLRRRLGLDQSAIVVTSAANQGARIEKT